MKRFEFHMRGFLLLGAAVALITAVTPMASADEPDTQLDGWVEATGSGREDAAASGTNQGWEIASRTGAQSIAGTTPVDAWVAGAVTSDPQPVALDGWARGVHDPNYGVSPVDDPSGGVDTEVALGASLAALVAALSGALIILHRRRATGPAI